MTQPDRTADESGGGIADECAVGLVGLAQKPIETEEDWQEFEAVWGKLEKNE